MPHPSLRSPAWCWSIQTCWLRFLARVAAPAASPGCCSLDLSQRAAKSNPKSWNSAGKRGYFRHGSACPGGCHILGGEGARQSPNFSGLAPGEEARGLQRGAEGQRSDAEDSSSSSARAWGRAAPVNIASVGSAWHWGHSSRGAGGCRRSPIRAGAEQEGTGVPGSLQGCSCPTSRAAKGQGADTGTRRHRKGRWRSDRGAPAPTSMCEHRLIKHA